MLGLGSFPAADVSTSQVFQGKPSGRHQRSVSPWTPHTAAGVECARDYRQLGPRSLPDQFTPPEYFATSTLPQRQLQWVTSQPHGYHLPPEAYDVETAQSGGHHLGHLHPVRAATSKHGWPSGINPTAAAVQCSETNRRIHTFHDPANNYFADGSLEPADNDDDDDEEDIAVQMCNSRGQFVDMSQAFNACRAHMSDPSQYCLQPSVLYPGSHDGGVKRDPASLTDWNCALPPVWHHAMSSSSSSVGAQAASTSISSSTLPYVAAAQYTPAAPVDNAEWSTSCEQQSTKITPSTSIGKTRTRDKYRTVYTEKQRVELEEEYERSTYITSQRKASISAAVGLSERQVKIWFQNRRAKDRKQRRRAANKQQPSQPQLQQDETETSSRVSPPSLVTATASPLRVFERKFMDSALFYDPHTTSMISDPTYYSTIAR